jgi:type IV secretory pathway VirB4 component
LSAPRGRPGERSPAGALLARQGFALPRQVGTTAHLQALYPFSLESGLGHRGVYIGRNRLTGGEGFFFDLFEAYDAGHVQGPNALVIGAGAYGKSALMKSYVFRSTMLRTSGRDRFVSVIDPKGEWVALARALDWQVLQALPGRAIGFNPLESPGADAAHLLTHRAGVTSALLAVSLGSPELDPGQRRLVSAVHAQLQGGSATLADVRAVLAEPPVALAAALDTTPDELLERRRGLLDAAAILLDHDLPGLGGSQTTTRGPLSSGSGLVLDLSALLSNRRALRLMMTAAAGWLAGLMYSRPDLHKLNIIDEGWAALDDIAVVRLLQDQWRVGRQWGCANILITHALADLHSQADDGSTLTKIADGLLNTTSVRIYLHQNPEQLGDLAISTGLTSTATELLGRLNPFESIWQIGRHTAFVDHVMSPYEWTLCDTDTAMRAR